MCAIFEVHRQYSSRERKPLANQEKRLLKQLLLSVLENVGWCRNILDCSVMSETS